MDLEQFLHLVIRKILISDILIHLRIKFKIV